MKESVLLSEDVEAIVIVDDEQLDRRAIIRCLPRRLLEHYAIVELEDGQQLLEFCRSSIPTAILLDNQLPGATGVDVLLRLSEIAPVDEIGVVLLSGMVDNQTISSAFRAGAHDYLHKSELSPERLREVMRRAIEKSTAARELRLSRQSLQSALAETRAAVASQGRFVAALSHELRNPITGLVGLSQLIDDSNLDARDAEYLALLRQSAREVLTLTDSLLERETLKHAHSGTGESFSLDDCTHSIRNVLSLQVMQKEVVISTAISKAIPDRLSGNLPALKQILLNLLANAIKFSPSGGEIKLTVTFDQKDDPADDRRWMRFAVADKGIGIAADKRRQIFQPFSEVSQETRRSHGGTGLGLSIVRELVTLMGGEIWIESEPGEGTTFLFTFPVSLR